MTQVLLKLAYFSLATAFLTMTMTILKSYQKDLLGALRKMLETRRKLVDFKNLPQMAVFRNYNLCFSSVSSLKKNSARCFASIQGSKDKTP